MWRQIQRVDDAQAEAQDYAEEYIKDPTAHDQDVIFMHALRTRIGRYHDEIEAFQELFVRKCHDKTVVLELDGEEVQVTSIPDIPETRNAHVVRRCRVCGQVVPRVKYPGWNE